MVFQLRVIEFIVFFAFVNLDENKKKRIPNTYEGAKL